MDFAAVVPLIISILGALGVGSAVGQWVAGGKDRRAARAAALEKLGAVEQARWLDQGPQEDFARFTTASRQLEAAALIARVPRSAVILYLQYAEAALAHLHAQVEDLRGDLYDEAGLPSTTDDVVSDAASVVSRAAWSSPATRWVWLRWRLRRVRRAAANLDDRRFHTSLMLAQRSTK